MQSARSPARRRRRPGSGSSSSSRRRPSGWRSEITLARRAPPVRRRSGVLGARAAAPWPRARSRRVGSSGSGSRPVDLEVGAERRRLSSAPRQLVGDRSAPARRLCLGWRRLGLGCCVGLGVRRRLGLGGSAARRRWVSRRFRSARVSDASSSWSAISRGARFGVRRLYCSAARRPSTSPSLGSRRAARQLEARACSRGFDVAVQSAASARVSCCAVEKTHTLAVIRTSKRVSCT